MAKIDVADVAELGYWFDLAGAEPENLAGEIGGLTTALEGGYLGCAAGAGRKKDLHRMLQLAFPQWYFARVSVHVLKLNDSTIGVCAVGPPHAAEWIEGHRRQQLAVQ